MNTLTAARAALLFSPLLLSAAPGARAQDGAAPVASIAPRGDRIQQVQADLGRGVPQAAPRRDVFAPQTWAPPPAPVVKPKPAPELHGPPAPPPPPPPPALTLVYLGQLDVAGEPTVYYLAQGDRVHAVSIGDTIDGVYRVVAREGRDLALIYLPLNAKQLLSLNRPS
jgi:hypothetical protein